MCTVQMVAATWLGNVLCFNTGGGRPGGSYGGGARCLMLACLVRGGTEAVTSEAVRPTCGWRLSSRVRFLQMFALRLTVAGLIAPPGGKRGVKLYTLLYKSNSELRMPPPCTEKQWRRRH